MSEERPRIMYRAQRSERLTPCLLANSWMAFLRSLEQQKVSFSTFLPSSRKAKRGRFDVSRLSLVMGHLQTIGGKNSQKMVRTRPGNVPQNPGGIYGVGLPGLFLFYVARATSCRIKIRSPGGMDMLRSYFVKLYRSISSRSASCC